MIPDEDWVETVQQNEETPANLVRYPDSNVDRQLMSKFEDNNDPLDTPLASAMLLRIRLRYGSREAKEALSTPQPRGRAMAYGE